MQTFTDEQHFTHPAADVLARYTDPKFLAEKYALLGRQDIELKNHETEGDVVRMSFAYSDKPGMDVPGFAKKFVPERAHVHQNVRWDCAGKLGTIEVKSDGSPVDVQGEMRLTENADGGCTNTITWNVKCSIPLVGGKLEKLLAEGLRHKARQDWEVTQKLLGE